MNHHSQLLNLIAESIGAKTYVEIGVFNPSHNFDLINVSKKMGVDPAETAGAKCRMGSDEFFDFMIAAGAQVDLSWIDGLHHAEQVARDAQKAWAITRPGGVLAFHDCNPHKESITHVPRDSREWCGDVYKVASNIANSSKFTADFDYGCLVIRKESEHQDLIILDREISWEDFDRMREYYLHLVPVDRAIEIIKSWSIEPDIKLPVHFEGNMPSAHEWESNLKKD